MQCLLTMLSLQLAIGLTVPSEPIVSQEVAESVLTLYPNVGRSPDLKNPLLPPWQVRRDANAATTYYRCVLLLQGNGGVRAEPDLWAQLMKWLQTPLAELPQDEVRTALNRFGSVLMEVEVASRRNVCEWELSIPEHSEDLFGILLPELQELRSVGRLLAIRARLEIAEHKYDDAMKTLQTGYAMARHVSKLPFLIGDLVGMALINMMNDQVLELASSPDSPNLYWSLTALPHPVISLRESLELEGEGIYMVFPQLLAAKTARLTPKIWDEKLDEFLNKWNESIGLIGAREENPAKVIRKNVVAQVDKAKAGLKTRGYSAASIKAMPDAQAILLYTALTYSDLRDNLYKWSSIPYAEGKTGLKNAEAELQRNSTEQEIVPVAGSLLPSLGAALRAMTRVHRRIDLLRILESIRYYAGQHDRKLPASLADMKSLPIPSDPMTGNPFKYQQTGTEAILEAVAIGKYPATRYRLRIAEP